MSNRLVPDATAGLTVACVALPLNLAIAMASGLPASMGLVSGIVAGVVAALLGGARLQITGPEAALVPTVLVIAQTHGVAGVVVATCFAGVVQIALGLLRAGVVARSVPPPVVRGFMAGIGVLILVSQLPVLLGVHGEPGTAPDIDRLAGLLLGVAAIVCMMVSPRFGALLGLVLCTAAGFVLSLNVHQVGQLPSALPAPTLPSFAGLDLWSLAPMALSLAFLASLGSMLSASALEALTKERGETSNQNRELIAQGVTNIVCALFGGLPVMGAIVRSAVSVQAGAQTRAASCFHALVLAAALYFAGSLVSEVPLAALAAILLTVGARLINIKEVRRMWQVKRSAAVIVVVTAVLIAATNFYVGILGGLLLSLLVSLIETATAHVAIRGLKETDCSPAQFRRLDAIGVQVVEARGSLTLLSTSRLDRVLPERPPWPRVVILDFRQVTLIDITALYVLQHALDCLEVRGGRFALVLAPGSTVAATFRPVRLLARAIGSKSFVSVSDVIDHLDATDRDGEETVETIHDGARLRPKPAPGTSAPEVHDDEGFRPLVVSRTSH